MTAHDLIASVRDAVRLALGQPVPEDPDWPQLFEVARAERLLGIAWVRSGPAIRAAAPRPYVAMWREVALDLDRRARNQLDLLGRLTGLLTTQGVGATVLKGPPLSMRLYGAVGARQSVDLDLLVLPHQRGTCKRALEAAGWIRWVGEAPWDEGFYRREAEHVWYLEIHSHIPGEALSHCGPLEVERERFEHGPGVLDVASGIGLPVYLAGNMAKHGVLPLSALVDFDALWSSGERSQREAAVELARGARLHQCLRWAIKQTALLHAAADGSPDALRKLGVRASGREFGHAFLRLIDLADHPVDAARVAAAWVWPRSSRGSLHSLGTVWRRRVHKPLGEMGSVLQRYVGR